MDNILGVSFIIASIIAIGWNLKQSKNDVKLSDLALANIEALANNESSTSSCIPMPGAFCSYTINNQTYILIDYIESSNN